MPLPPAKLVPGNTLSIGRFRQTLAVLRASHNALLSQAQLLQSIFPPGLRMQVRGAPPLQGRQVWLLVQHALGQVVPSRVRPLPSHLPSGTAREAPQLAVLLLLACWPQLCWVSDVRAHTVTATHVETSGGPPFFMWYT